MFGFIAEHELLKKPGVYMITNLITGRQYIGYSTNIYRRIRTHAKAVGRPEELRQLIETNGTDKFKVEILYYSFDRDEDHLAEVETSLISCYETLFPKGFNVVLYLNDPTHRAAIAKAVSQPGTRAKMSNSRKRWMQNPENREKHRLAAIAGMTPERNELVAQAHRGKIWLTNGIDNQRLFPDQPIPEGWYLGKTQRRKTD